MAASTCSLTAVHLTADEGREQLPHPGLRATLRLSHGRRRCSEVRRQLCHARQNLSGSIAYGIRTFGKAPTADARNLEGLGLYRDE